MYFTRKGFTLIELIIVVRIIGIWAAIAAPMMMSNVSKAKASEALAALGAIRTAERLYYAENNAYIDIAGVINSTALNAYMHDGDIAGVYFAVNDYGVSNTTKLITATGGSAGSTAVKNGEVKGFNITMNLVTGEIINNGY